MTLRDALKPRLVDRLGRLLGRNFLESLVGFWGDLESPEIVFKRGQRLILDGLLVDLNFQFRFLLATLLPGHDLVGLVILGRLVLF